MSSATPDVPGSVSYLRDDESTDLTRRLIAGDRAALDEALALHWTHAIQYAGRWVQSVEDAKDLVQEAFLRLWQGAGRWSPDTRIRPLLFGIIRNLALKDGRRRAVRSAYAEQVRDTSRPFMADPADDAIAGELKTAMLAAVSRLPERRRLIFVLSRREGLTHQEIAHELGISPQTVANQLSAALEQLRQALTPFLHVEPLGPRARRRPSG